MKYQVLQESMKMHLHCISNHADGKDLPSNLYLRLWLWEAVRRLDQTIGDRELIIRLSFGYERLVNGLMECVGVQVEAEETDE